MQDIGVHGEIKKFVVTSVVMRHFYILPGAPRACADFCDPTAVFRLNLELINAASQLRNAVQTIAKTKMTPQHNHASVYKEMTKRGMLKKAASGVLALLPNLRAHRLAALRGVRAHVL